MPKKARPRTKRPASDTQESGKLRIGDTWNAITIIALSQNNPLKAIAEFVENSIDAQARNITIIRGKERGRAFLRVTDDGQGIRCNEAGRPDFKHVATHICDSIKRQMKAQGSTGIQGEFGIGLLSFWTVGEELLLTSSGSDGKTYQMKMVKGCPDYEVRERRTLFAIRETELEIGPLLPGVRQISGEKIQWYLAAELRDRIRRSGVSVKVIDRSAHKEYPVVPREFEGNLLRLPPIETPHGEIYLELYLSGHDPAHAVSLCRQGTRVLPDLTSMPHFQREPWTLGHLEGIIDAPFLRLTPGTRDGVVQDEMFAVFWKALSEVEPLLNERIEELRQAEEQKASEHVLKAVQRALREALLALPEEEYDWFSISRRAKGAQRPEPADRVAEGVAEEGLGKQLGPKQQEFFEFPGTLYSATIAPSSCAIMVKQAKQFRGIARDKARRAIEREIEYVWRIVEGAGSLENETNEVASFQAGEEAGLVRLEVVCRQGPLQAVAEALVTVTDSLIPPVEGGKSSGKGLPGYTFEHAPTQLWRSRYRESENLIVINSGHRDFVFASRHKSRKLRYICRLFSKELVLKNFPGQPTHELLERMIELSMYTEENLK